MLESDTEARQPSILRSRGGNWEFNSRARSYSEIANINSLDGPKQEVLCSNKKFRVQIPWDNDRHFTCHRLSTDLASNPPPIAASRVWPAMLQGEKQSEDRS